MQTSSSASINPYRFYPWLIVILSSLLLFYKYVMQISPSVMTHQLMAEFQIEGAGLGNLAAMFFYTYAVTQLFVGVLLDRLSPRYLSSFAVLASAVGTYFFAKADTLTGASVARCFMGVGAAFATVSYMKLTANWFRPEKFALVGGLLATAAMIGAIFGQAPLAWMVSVTGWRASLITIAWLGVAIAALFVFFVRDKPKVQISPNTPHETHSIRVKDVIAILRKKETWILTCYSGLAFSPVAVFGGLWGNPFITEAYHFSTTQTANFVSLIFYGLAIGGPVLGFLSDRLNNRRSVMLYSAILSLVTVTLVIYINDLPLWILGCLLFLFGFGTGAFMLGFAIGKELNPIKMAATVIALINTGDAIFGAFTEPLIGKFLDMGWSGTIKDNTHYFSVHDYHIAFLVIPAYLLIAAGLVFTIKSPTPNDKFG